MLSELIVSQIKAMNSDYSADKSLINFRTYFSRKYFKVVSFISVVFDDFVELRSTHPPNMILHASCHVESWVSHSIDSNFDMTLLDVHDGILDRLCHLHSLHYDWKSSSCEGANCHLFARSKALTRVYYTHLE